MCVVVFIQHSSSLVFAATLLSLFGAVASTLARFFCSCVFQPSLPPLFVTHLSPLFATIASHLARFLLYSCIFRWPDVTSPLDRHYFAAGQTLLYCWTGVSSLWGRRSLTAEQAFFHRGEDVPSPLNRRSFTAGQTFLHCLTAGQTLLHAKTPAEGVTAAAKNGNTVETKRGGGEGWRNTTARKKYLSKAMSRLRRKEKQLSSSE